MFMPDASLVVVTLTTPSVRACLSHTVRAWRHEAYADA